jgi:uncharacterized protein YkwD
MRFRLPSVVVLACACLGCGAGLAPQSNGVKMGEALAFVAAAGAAQVAQSVMEQHARNNAPVTHAGGVGVSQGCDNDDQYGCVSVTASSAAGTAPDHVMDEDEARDYVLGYVNGVRKLNAQAPVVRDETVDAFAQAGSEALAQDHKAGQHMADHGKELRVLSAELQGSPEGSGAGALQDQIAEMLLRWMGEGPGGMHHDVLLRPEWHKLGVGIVSRGGRMYFTVDFAG